MTEIPDWLDDEDDRSAPSTRIKNQVRLAIAMGLVERIESPSTLGKAPYRIVYSTGGGQICDDLSEYLPNPFINVNDDYAVLEWIRGCEGEEETPESRRFKDTMWAQFETTHSWNYQVGDWAKAALYAIDSDDELSERIFINNSGQICENLNDNKFSDKNNIVAIDDGLTFNALRAANTLRLPQFKNARGEPAHSEPDGSDWCLAQWCNAVCGELGEAANLIKKIERGDVTLDEAREDLGKELADVVTYLDILAMRAGVDLGNATIEKFNEVSDRVDSDVYIGSDDDIFFWEH